MTTFMYRKVLDVICLSHSLDNVGRRFETPVLDEFLHWWVSLFARSPAARLQWEARSGVAPKTHCSTRWWSLYEVAAQAMELFGDIRPFLEECTYSPSACQHLISLLDRAEDEVKVELAATIDAAKVFCQKPTHWKAKACWQRRCTRICKSWPLQQLTDIIRMSFESWMILLRTMLFSAKNYWCMQCSVSDQLSSTF